MFSISTRRPLLAFLLITALAAGLIGVPIARSAQPPDVTANAGGLQQAQTLPIFSLTAPTVNAGVTSNLSQRFSEIYARQGASGENYLSNPRYTVPNTTTTSLITQYAATGGFYALNLGEIGREDARGPVDTENAKLLACQFLTQNGFMDGQGNLLLGPQTPQNVITPNPFSCDFAPGQGPGYRVRTIQAATVGAANPNTAPVSQTVGVLVQVPMSISVGQERTLNLGGPGGHLSLLFSTTTEDQGASLDNSVPGLGAVAMPFFGRSLTRGESFVTRDVKQAQAQVEAQVRASYPGATNVTVPEPELLYFVSDAAVEQQVMEPMLSFPGIQVTVGGETLILRDVTVPALEGGAGGFGPSVSITAPANGSTYAPGAKVTLRGQIGDGAAPFTYEWIGPDGASLAAAATISAPGAVELQTSTLPAVGKGGLPQVVNVTLRVTDDLGAVREATVALVPNKAPALYLPLIQRESGGGAAARGAAAIEPAASLAQVSYTFGVEANWDYPPSGAGGSDLPGVIPDATGLRSGLLGYGYSSRFYWTNSSAWEKDWRDCSLGGIDCSYGVDRADYVYYAGHGGAGGLSLASSKDSTWFSGNNARYQTLRWAGFASCQTLRVQGYTAPNEPIRRWFGAFQGAHLLTGFNSNMADVAFGGRLVDNMRVPSFFGIDFDWAQQTIAQAWVSTAFQLNAGKPAYLYARGGNGANPANDKLPRPGKPIPARPLPVISYHWVWWNE